MISGGVLGLRARRPEKVTLEGKKPPSICDIPGRGFSFENERKMTARDHPKATSG